MIQIVSTITVDTLKPATLPIVVYAKQFDANSRYVKIRVTQDGVFFPIETSANVYLNGTRTDKQKRSFEGTVDTDGTLLLPLNQWLLYFPGSVDCDATVQTTGATFTTMSFMLVVLESSYPSEDSDSGGSGGTTAPIQPLYEVASLTEVKSYIGG